MSREARASDWEFAGLISAGCSVGLAAGGWSFTFRSKSLNYWETFVMLGGGVGTVGVNVEVSLPSHKTGDLSWSPIACQQKFSLFDLHRAAGVIGSAGVAVGLGYSYLFATAYNQKTVAELGRVTGSLFTNALNDGYGGVGERAASGKLKAAVTVGAVGAGGVWFSVGQLLKAVFQAAADIGKGTIAALSGGLFQAGEALLEGRGMWASNRFCNGYARLLAEITDTTWTISDEEYYRLLKLNWKQVLDSQTALLLESGSKTPTSVLDKIEEAGAAYILQNMYRQYYSPGGEKKCEKNYEFQRSVYGKDRNIRRGKYQDILYKQVQKGSKPLGIPGLTV